MEEESSDIPEYDIVGDALLSSIALDFPDLGSYLLSDWSGFFVSLFEFLSWFFLLYVVW